MAVALGVTVLLLPPAALAERPPANRTYFVVAVGLVSSYDVKAECFSFTSEGLCSLGGDICGTWQTLESGQDQSSFGFQLFALDEGRPLTLEGVGTVEGRGAQSAIAGAGRLTGIGPTSNFAFSGRRSSVDGCLDLLADFQGGSQTVVQGSGEVATETRAVEGFSGVVLGGVGRLYIDQTGSESLTISAEDNILPLLRSEVVGDLLILGPAPGSTISNSEDIIYRLTADTLNELVVSGVTVVQVKRLKTSRLTLNLSGVSTVKVGGKVNRQDVTISGTGVLKAKKLKSKTAYVDISGLGHAVMRVSKRLSGRIGDFGILEYLGDPVVDVDVSGFAELRDVGD